MVLDIRPMLKSAAFVWGAASWEEQWISGGFNSSAVYQRALAVEHSAEENCT